MDSIVTLTGPGPFYLSVQEATAVAHKDNGVMLILKGLLKNEQDLETLNIQLPNNEAEKLAGKILTALRDAREEAHKAKRAKKPSTKPEKP
jgi:hypothetical protein